MLSNIMITVFLILFHKILIFLKIVIRCDFSEYTNMFSYTITITYPTITTIINNAIANTIGLTFLPLITIYVKFFTTIFNMVF